MRFFRIRAKIETAASCQPVTWKEEDPIVKVLECLKLDQESDTCRSIPCTGIHAAEKARRRARWEWVLICIFI